MDAKTMKKWLEDACACESCQEMLKYDKDAISQRRLRALPVILEIFKVAGVEPSADEQSVVLLEDTSNRPYRDSRKATVIVRVGQDWLQQSDHPAALAYRRLAIEMALTQ